MRPIDADRLKETIKKLDVESPDIKTARIISRTIQEIFSQIIDDEPTIEVKPDKDKKVHKVDKLRGVWATMKSRCYLKTNEKFYNYGKRGIVVCDEWKTNFKAFKSWALENGYQEGLTLDRIDVNGNYCPSNCRWVTNKVQQNNRTNNRIVEYKGEKYTLKQLSEKAKLPYSTLWNRLNLGWSVEEAVESPRLFMHNKEVQNGR